MKVLSLYCGAGGIDEGLKQVGIKTTLAIDHEKDCLETIKLNHPGCETICGKVGDYIESLPKAYIVIGGPPCPEFSRAKTNRTFDMCEVNNFWKAVEHCKADYFLMENVQDVKKKLYKTNYLINAADYGVPQVRLRRFFTNLPRPEPTHAENPQNTLSGNSLQKWVSVKNALGLDGILEDRKTVFGNYGEFREYDVSKPSISVVTDARLFIVDKKFPGRNAHELTKNIDEPSMTVVVNNDLQITNHKIYSTKYLKEKNPIMYKKHPPNYLKEPCCTIASKDRTTDGFVTDGQYARKLTNDELAILQGFPKDFKFFGNKGSVRRQIGNAVPPPVSKAFFQQIILCATKDRNCSP